MVRIRLDVLVGAALAAAISTVSADDPKVAGVATDTARIGIFKAETKLALEETTPTGGGHGYGNPEARTHHWVRISLTRKSGGEAVTGRKVRLTLDGKPFGNHATGNVMLPDGPFPAGLAMVPWVVEALFEGDDCYQSTEPARLVVKKKP